MTSQERGQLAQLRAAYAELLTAARASVAAQQSGGSDPLIFVRRVSASQALAAARDVLALTDALHLTGVQG